MLVLTRKLGERIVIGDNIVLTVVKIDNGKVRLGIDAPKAISVYREELLKPVTDQSVATPHSSDAATPRHND